MIEETWKEPYSVGALLYCPALRESIADTLADGQLPANCSVALCLEDTISEQAVPHALEQLAQTFQRVHQASAGRSLELPRLFVRVRDPLQVETVFRRLLPWLDSLSGFIFPKYSLTDAPRYNEAFRRVLERSPKALSMMPILESEDIIDPLRRTAVLAALKEQVDSMRPYVLNVRVGGNDFCGAFGVRRHVDETIYEVLPVARLLCDILTVFSRDYVVSGPVWEYYAGGERAWEEGLRRELKYDLLNGFVGKTVIHPKQIPVVTEALRVSPRDLADAREILSWSAERETLVDGSSGKERMNEVNTHWRWARRVTALAAVYGVRDA